MSEMFVDRNKKTGRRDRFSNSTKLRMPCYKNFILNYKSPKIIYSKAATAAPIHAHFTRTS
jgi:hypothetical protein